MAWLGLYITLIPALVAVLPIDRTSHLGGALQFFFYDTPNVLMLLTGVVFVMGMINSYFTPERKVQPNARHTYGFKRATILAAFANALLLLVAMGGLAWEALGRLMSNDVSLQEHGVTIMVVAGIGIVINTATALLFMRGRDDLNIRGAFLHMAADALVSAGVVVAGALTLWMGWVWLDPVVSLLIAAVILWGT